MTFTIQPHQHCQAQLEQGILTIAIDRAESKNALYGDLYLYIAQLLDNADQSNDVRCVILRGANQDFTAGNDMQDFMSYFKQPPIQGKAGELPPFVLIKSVAKFSKPLILAIKGVAIGIGVTLTLHADLVYADDSAVFQMPFVSLGLSPEGGIGRLMSQQIGYHHTAELLFTAKKFNRQTAEKINLINTLPDGVDVYDYALQTAQHLVQLPLASLKQSKALMKHNIAETLAYIDDEAEIFMQRVQSPETKEAVTAFMEKRKPDFSQFA